MLNNQLEALMSNCKSELLNHTLQSIVVSKHIKNVNSYLDECIGILGDTATHDIKRERSSNYSESKKGNILFFSYCMSKWNSQFMNSVSGLSVNQSDAFEYLAQRLGTKANTIKNYRDSFDSHVTQQRSKRQGWKKPLNSELRAIIEKYDDYTEPELVKVAKNIL